MQCQHIRPTLSCSCFFQVLQDMVPPKKHLLRHQPANAQIGLMEGNTFCTTLQPRLFTMDLNVMEHKVFFTEVGKPVMCSLLSNYFTVLSLWSTLSWEVGAHVQQFAPAKCEWYDSFFGFVDQPIPPENNCNCSHSAIVKYPPVYIISENYLFIFH